MGNYRNVKPLLSPRNDAVDVAAVLKDLKFQGGPPLLDPDREQMDKALADFAVRLEKAKDALAFVYYSGHGVEVGGRNLLLPADFPAGHMFDRSNEDAAYYAMSRQAVLLDRMLDLLTRAKPKYLIVVLDACRDNPLQPDTTEVAALTKTLGGPVGLAPVATPPRSYIVYAAGKGQKALDRLSPGDTVRNSLFTRHLLATLATPGLSFDQSIKATAELVEADAWEKGSPRHVQQPSIYHNIYRDIVLAPAPAPSR